MPTTDTNNFAADFVEPFDLWLDDLHDFDELRDYRPLPREQSDNLPAVSPTQTTVAEKSIVPVCQWIEDNCWNWSQVNMVGGVYDYTGAERIRLDSYQKDILNHVLTFDENGQFPYWTVIWSQPKKHGKTQIAAGVAAWMADQIEPPNLLLSVASNQEQSAGLIFNSALPTLYPLAYSIPKHQTSKPEVRMNNGTIFRAIPSNYAGQAGLNYGGTFFSELWTYKTERDRRLFDELPPIMTRKNSIRWIETYAGFEDESDLLKDFFLRIFEDTSEKRPRKADGKDYLHDARPVPGLEHITTNGRPSCWHIPEEGLFYFCDHEIRASWMQGERGAAYIKAQRADLRESQFIRLWENRWQSAEGNFIKPQQFRDSLNLAVERRVPMFLAGDASERNDHTALVGVEKVIVKILGKWQERYRVVHVRVWDPHGKDIDLDETIAKEVKRIYDAGLLLGPFHYDRYQMHQVAINLRKKGVPCKKFDQGAERLQADTFLYKLFNKGLIDCYPNPILESHLISAKAKEYEGELVRIIKGTATDAKKVDAAVALSMACFKASKFHPPRPTKQTISTSIFD